MAHAFTEGPYWNVEDVKADADVVILRTVSMDAGSSVLGVSWLQSPLCYKIQGIKADTWHSH